MSELKAMCSDAGFTRVQTYLASGNVVFESEADTSRVKTELESRLHSYAGKPVVVILRSVPEMRAVLQANPFPSAEPNKSYVFFLDDKPPTGALDHVSGQQDEQIALGKREIFVHYPSGMGRSKLKIPAAKTGTARNMNSVAKLVELASQL
jgi:uncharacterized protein (DUF1697 family)